jgi:F0F1-type ATP synthase membrane subunit b/b'
MAEAKKKESDILDKARGEAGGIMEDMKSSIQAQSAEVRKTLREDLAPLARSISEKILGRSVS